jgi:hypothetical protein
MRHDFSANFLKVLPPDTNFGEAWESLCYDLLGAELGDLSLIRLAPPDKGVDILSRALSTAYQCKSDERGALGSLSADGSVDSLKTAVGNRKSIGWTTYTFCTNANFTGTAFTRLNEEAINIGLSSSEIDFKGPQYWDNLCTKHFAKVEDRFDYRITATEKQVMEAFKSANYYDRYVKEFSEKIRNADFTLVLKNNRTPVELAIPFSPDLTIQNCVHAVQQILGVSLDWTNFTDLGTSAGPSISLTVDRVAQDFNKKIADLVINPGDKLEFWIKIVWRDEMQKEAETEHQFYARMHLAYYKMNWTTKVKREVLTYQARRDATIERAESLIQDIIWSAAISLKGSNNH